MPSRRELLALVPAAALCVLAREAGASGTKSDENYPLDELERRVARHGPIRCPAVELETYRGKLVRYREPAKVHPAFRARLEKMEAIALAEAKRIYGRAPSHLTHLGTFSCRRIGGYPELLSEHGIGNAIDLAGFDFAPLPRGEVLPAGLPAELRHAFTVRLERHWQSKSGPAGVHARFLRAFAQAVIDRRDVFRVVLGPSYPGHHNHFHLDMAPYRLVDVFEDA